jgi:hypothetical protein
VPAPSGRFTALHCAAFHGHIGAAVLLLVGGASQTIKDNDGYAVPPTASVPVVRPDTIGPVGAGERLTKSHKPTVKRPSTTPRWR